MAGPLRKQVKDVVASGRSRLLFDLSEVPFTDSSGLSVLVAALNAANERFISPAQSLTGERRISLQRYEEFVAAVRAVLEGPA